MTTICLRLGQCGNQIPIDESLPGVLNLAVDSESKTLPSSASSMVVKLGTSGSGNNWTCGYSAGDRSELWDMHRRLVEQCDYYLGALIINSTAGGTGSGVCSAAVERFRDYHPKSYIFNTAILPFNSGESSLQHYNTLLNLSWIQNYSDGCLLLANSDLATRDSRSNAGDRQHSSGFGGINRKIARILSGFLAPSNSPSVLPGRECFETTFNGWTILNTMSPVVKFFYGTSAESMDDMITWGNNSGHCVAAQLYCRSSSRYQYSTAARVIHQRLGMANWVRDGLDVVLGKNCVSAPECTLLYNPALAIHSELANITRRVRCKLETGAFIHWYERHYEGRFVDVLTDSLECLEVASSVYQRLFQ